MTLYKRTFLGNESVLSDYRYEMRDNCLFSNEQVPLGTVRMLKIDNDNRFYVAEPYELDEYNIVEHRKGVKVTKWKQIIL